MSAFQADGAIGKEFKGDGAIGSIGEAIGGPLASDDFNPDGAIGGSVDSAAKQVENNASDVSAAKDPGSEAQIGDSLSGGAEERI